MTLSNHGVEAHGLMMEQTKSAANKSETPVHSVNFSETNSATGVVLPEALVSTGQKSTILVGKAADVSLLDERALLACIVRTIPPGSSGRIRISSTVSGDNCS